MRLKREESKRALLPRELFRSIDIRESRRLREHVLELFNKINLLLLFLLLVVRHGRLL